MTARRLLIICPDAGLTSALREKLEAAEWAEVAIETTYPSPGQLARLVHDRRPSIVLIALTEAEYALNLIEELHVTFPGVLVAATHSINEPDLIMRAIRSGASEYLGPPFEVEYLERVLEQKQDLLAPVKPKGRMITVLPAAGGCGASTVAVHLAAWMARQTAKSVLLFDWDLHCGSIAFRLRLKPEFTLADALERSGVLDEFWSKLVSSWKGVDLLSPAHPDRVSPEDLGRVPAVINSAKRTYDWIISDLPPAVYGGFEVVLAESEVVLLVCTPDLVSLHLARRRCEELRRLGLAQDVVKLVVNREVGVNYKPDEIRGLVGIPVARTLPNDNRAVNAAWIEGRLVTEHCDLGKLLQKLALEVLGPAEPAAPAPAKRWKAIPNFLEAPTA